MASHSIQGQVWPSGTTVSVYPAAAQPAGSDGAPAGTAVTTAVQNGAGITFSGLSENVRYVAYAGGVARRFLIPQQDPMDARSLRARLDELTGDTLPAVSGKIAVHLNDFLPAGYVNNSTDATAAIQDWGVAAQVIGTALGSVDMQYGPGTYRFTPSLGVEAGAVTPMITLTDLNGVSVSGSGTFADQRAYTPATTQIAELFHFTNCQGVKWRGRVTSQQNTTTLPVGLKAVVFRQGCRGMDVDLEMIGGRDGVAMQRLSTDPESWRSSDGKVVVRTTNVFYPWSGQFCGDNMDVTINSNGSGRAFIVYATTNARIKVFNKDQRIQSYIGNYDANGCDGIDVDWTEDPTSTQFGAQQIVLHYRGHTVPITHRNIGLHFGGHSALPSDLCRYFSIMKVMDDETTYDSTARGHKLDGLKVSGRFENNSTLNDVFEHGSFGELVAGDFMQNLDFHDISIHGTNARVYFKARALVDVCHVDNVTSDYDFHVENQTNGRVVHTACKAARLSRDATDIHHYIGCTITGASQVDGVGKSFSGGSGTGAAGLRVVRATFASVSNETLVRDSGTDKLLYKDINGSPVYVSAQQYQTISDADVTLSAASPAGVTIYEAALTANRTVTLSTTNAIRGTVFRVVRAVTSTGAFNLNVGTGPLKALAAGQWCDVAYNGAAWRLVAFGSL